MSWRLVSAFSATESTHPSALKLTKPQKILKNFGLAIWSFKEREKGLALSYLFRLLVRYAQTLTIATVRIAPANPEIMKLDRPASDGKTAISQGIKYVAVTCAITPAKNPNSATIPKTFNLSLIQFTFLF